MTKMRSTHPPSKPLERKQGSPHCFFGLPPPDDNPTAFVDIKANFFQHTKVNKSRLFGAIAHDLSVIVVDRSFQIGVISFDIDRFKSASLLSIMPRRLSILQTLRLSPISPCQIRPGIYLLRLPFWVSSMYKSDLRSAGVSKLRGYRRQVHKNAARKFTS